MIRIKNNQPTVIAMLFILSLFAFLLGKQGQEVVGFESRFYLFALEMWQHGLRLFPTTYQAPYPDYCSTSTYLIFFLAKLIGHLDKFVAVIPSAIAAGLTLVCTYLIGSLHSKKWGFYACLFLLSTSQFLKTARGITLDIYPALLTTYCFYYIYSHHVQQKTIHLSWLLFCLFLSFLFRGPIGLVIPTGVICFFYFLNKDFKQGMYFGLSALALLLAATGLLLGLAYFEGGISFVQDVLRMQIIGRIDHHAQPIYFYFTQGLKDYFFCFPLAAITVFLAIVAFLQKKSLPYSKACLQILSWALVIVIGMSFPGEKKIRYILPALPAFALLAAYPLAFAEAKLFTHYNHLIRRLLCVMPGCVLLGLLGVYYYLSKTAILVSLPFLYLGTLFFILQIINFYLKDLSSLLLVATCSFLFLFILVVEPIEIYLDRLRDFVVSTEQSREKRGASLIFYQEHPDGFPIKYIINMPKEDHIHYLNRPTDLLHVKETAFIITEKKKYIMLPNEIKQQFNIVTDETAGHVNMVVLKKKT